MVKVASIIVCLVVLAGYSFRRTRGWHMRLMTSAFVLDMALLLYVELTRNAIKTSVAPPHPFVTLHVLISVLVLALYARQLYTGLRFYRGRARIGGHGGSGRWFLGLRTANLVTSLFVGLFVHRPEAVDKENISARSGQVSETASDAETRAEKEDRA